MRLAAFFCSHAPCLVVTGCLLAPLAMTAGCRSAAPRSASSRLATPSPGATEPPRSDPRTAGSAPHGIATGAVAQASAVQPTPAAGEQTAVPRASPAPGRNAGVPNAFPAANAPLTWQPTQDALAQQQALVVEQVVDLVLQRNPSIEAMMAAWQAAAQRYPQVVSLDDPVLMSMVAPASLNSNTVDPAFIVGGSQKLPWFGKRAARGRVAQAEASAAFQDARTTRLEVAEAARLAFYDYYLARRLLELNRQNRSQVEQFRETARRRYEANLVPQQDVLQADVALSDVARRQLELERMDRVAAARLNTLLLRAPDAPLPPPPATLAPVEPLPPADLLRTLAVTSRPDLAALIARIRAEEAAAAVAAKDFYPDVEVYGRYDSFWQPASTQSPLRAQTGVNMNVPLYQRKRRAAVNEALFRASQRRAEFQQRLNDIHFEVQNIYEQVEQSRQTADLYGTRFLPIAESNVNSARSSYDVGRVPFLNLIQAQQQLIAMREKQQETLADYYRRQAELERVVGSPLPKAAERPAEQIPAPPPAASSGGRRGLGESIAKQANDEHG